MAEVLTTLSECICGEHVTDAEVAKAEDVVRCKASGCETQWVSEYATCPRICEPDTHHD